MEDKLLQTPVIPLVQASDPEVAIRTSKALVDGGLDVIEVVMRTPEALDCMAAIVEALPDAIVGAGTVLSAGQAGSALEAGAKFIVSPGLNEGVVEASRTGGVPVYPGVNTPSEVQTAWNLGLRTLKFFPAGLAGGTPMLKALGSVFRDVKFIPTGGVSASNLGEYLAVSSVLACGGSWLTPADEIAAGNYDAVTTLAREAAGIAQSARG
ncbi:bifunctional 4-hydroxy-2-oxoglutarate aldolase/2-dehydro-3-deoxy-phosphogluconate aldolase [Marinihelvus fidelis]|uniref:Bifunctional 4-hydroxy-2-oxoglutarate aldolase/2-dehydro-3-deoxy-phosphogluconate aldolase n=1 Tax=Marinihelvus fidelis TaxID=2613842 RepID=A0A5N0TAJ0_9GAMM|nr:bifunctional 4-hydroxy-2-oxoglutarate aldolase/2-dehydro-3-deoxy-phosphogluconate aldolase [Marinihelvus fidelis]